MKTTAVSILKIQRLALKSAADGIGKCSTWGSLYELIKQKIFSNYGAGAALFQRQTLHFFIDKHRVICYYMFIGGQASRITLKKLNFARNYK
jgi:hypothetical protein